MRKKVESFYSLAEFKQRLFDGEEFVMVDELYEKILNALGKNILFKGEGGEVKSIHIVDLKEYAWYNRGKEDAYNVKSVTDKYLNLYTINMFGDIAYSKIDRARVVFERDIPKMEKILSERKEERKDWISQLKKQNEETKAYLENL